MPGLMSPSEGLGARHPVPVPQTRWQLAEPGCEEQHARPPGAAGPGGLRSRGLQQLYCPTGTDEPIRHAGTYSSFQNPFTFLASTASCSNKSCSLTPHCTKKCSPLP